MQVIQVKDRTKVQPDHVYVIPPNKDMSILHGILHLLEPTAPRGLRLPIDFFLRALAQDQQERSVGVILSGMGSDGTLGLRAIKEKGGCGARSGPGDAPNSMACRAVRLMRVWRISWPPSRNCRRNSSRIWQTHSANRPERRAPRRQIAKLLGKSSHSAASPHRTRFFPLQTQHSLPPD